MRELDAWAIMNVGSAEANELFDIVGRAYLQHRNAGIEAAYNCLIREAIVDIERNHEPEVRAQFEKFRPALDAMLKAWPWLDERERGEP
jgi:hypothetical protein